MGKNRANQIRNLANRTIHSYLESNYADAILTAKRVIEQITAALLRHHQISPEVYQEKANRHAEWSLEKKIKECEAHDILDAPTCAELYLIKDWRNNLEHVSDMLALKGFASQSVEVVRKLYRNAEANLQLPSIAHWPDNLQAGLGNMLPFSPKGVSMKDGQLVVTGENGQRVCIDFINDGASWIDANGNKKFYRGSIGEGNNKKGWIG